MEFDFDLISNKLPVGVKEISFPDGQPHFEGIPTDIFSLNLICPTVQTRLANGNDIFRLLTLFYWMERCAIDSCTLYISYVTGARMDRSINNGPVTPEIVGDILSNVPVRIRKIHIFDPHSDVVCACLHNVEVHDNIKLVQRAIEHSAWTYDQTLLIGPDNGASKKIQKVAHALGMNATMGTKVRNEKTGELTAFGLTNPALVANRAWKNIMIVDDICDGGGTFVGLANAIRSFNDRALISLAVSHGIFSKGTNLAGIDRIYTTNSFQENGKFSNKVTQFDIKELW